MLDPERVRVAGGLERRALARTLGRCGRHAAMAQRCGQLAQNLLDIGVDARDRRSAKRAREIAILAMGVATFGEVEAPIGGGRDRLQPTPRGRGDRHRERRLRRAVSRARIVDLGQGEAIARELHDLAAQRRRPLGDCAAMREHARRLRHEHALWPPQARRGRSGAEGGRAQNAYRTWQYGISASRQASS